MTKVIAQTNRAKLHPPPPARTRSSATHPPACSGRNDLAHDHVAPKERKVNNIFYYNVGTSSSRDKVAFQHPAIFPESLVSDQIITWTDEGDLVYDCFMGSGTTAKVAEILDRRWFGSEISSEYIKIADQRLAPYIEVEEERKTA